MSYDPVFFKHKAGDKCPACHSTDEKKPKGILVKHSVTSWWLDCTVCKYTVKIKGLKIRNYKGSFGSKNR